MTNYPKLIGKRFVLNDKSKPFSRRNGRPIIELIISDNPFVSFDGQSMFYPVKSINKGRMFPSKIEANYLFNNYHSIEPQLVVSFHEYKVDQYSYKLIVAVNKYDCILDKSYTRKVTIADVISEFDEKNDNGCKFIDLQAPILSFSNYNQNVLFKDAKCKGFMYLYLSDLYFDVKHIIDYIKPHNTNNSLIFSFINTDNLSQELSLSGYQKKKSIIRRLYDLEERILHHSLMYLYDVSVVITKENIKRFTKLKYLIDHESSGKINRVLIRKDDSRNIYKDCYMCLMNLFNFNDLINIPYFEIKPVFLSELLQPLRKRKSHQKYIFDDSNEDSTTMLYSVSYIPELLYIDNDSNDLPLSQLEIAQFLKPKF